MYCEVFDKTGAGLAAKIPENLSAEGIDVSKMRGQGYDGCSAMSGRFKGVQTSPELDLLSAIETVDVLAAVLQQRRDDAETRFAELFEEIERICSDIGVEIELPRRCGTQGHRENHPSRATEEYYRVSLYIVNLDQLIQEFNSIFADCRAEALKIQFLVPKYVEKGQFCDLSQALDFYKDDLSCSMSVISAEYELWKYLWSKVPAEERPGNALKALNQCSSIDYPKISILLQNATLPVTTSTAERTSSVLKLLKTDLRSTMKGERLNGLTALKIHRLLLKRFWTTWRLIRESLKWFCEVVSGK
ncbi:uncharacterized protein LOC108863664 [Galendromus occidentalis]|uniref:Uncharacterized protein LOC108863664 n=1 Tax=Galendromus occidentalis TaxID=34638 RepID=A0AAJ7WH74_9ACAR|nr:uncharacterized protein LOC108863664 [Galendromus occidentalis]